MKNLIRLCVLSGVFLFFVGCSSTVQPKDVQSMKNVGVISSIGDSLMAHEDGLTKFGTYDNMVDISNWDINDYIADTFSQKLNGRFKVKVIDDKETEVILINDTYEFDIRKKHINNLMLKNKLDTIIYISKDGYHPSIKGVLSVNRAKVVLLPALHNGTVFSEVHFYQKIDGNIDLKKYMMIDGFRLNDVFWDEEKDSINVLKLDELEVMFKNKLNTTIERYLSENNMY